MRRLLSLIVLAGLLVATFGLPSSVGAGLGNPRTAYLAADVAIPVDGSYVDGPTLAIGNAGVTTTWLISAGVLTQYGAICRLWDGTTIVASGFTDRGTTTLSGFLTEPGAATVKVSCSDLGGDIILASYGAGNGDTVSWITAVKVN